MKTILKILGGLLAALVLLVGAVVAWALSTEYSPAPEVAVDVDCSGITGQIVAGEPFTLLSWNLQYGASRKYHFFYDGGDAVKVDDADVHATVDAIAALLKKEAPSIALLQEIDRGSDRTHRIDEFPPLVAAMAARCSATAPYHRSPFVPSPTTDPLGRVDMELGLLSRVPMSNAVRHQLPLLAEPRYRQIFNLKRALLTAELQVDGLDQPLAIAVTHLSAFSHGDGTLARQVDALDKWIAARPAGQAWILSGDMNMLPPGDDRTRLTAESELYADADNPVEKLFARYGEIFGDTQLDPAHRTYMPFGAPEPDRKIDYVFYGGPVHVLDASVLRDPIQVSDHLPVIARLIVGDLPPQPEPAPDEAAPGDETPGAIKGSE